MAATRRGFTLIELLVVISIIVVLLALLTPALDRAIYQAELAVCGANLHTVSAGALSYALSNKRRYPYRPMDGRQQWMTTQLTVNLGTFGNGDDRPVLRRALGPLNGPLNCPLTGRIDIDSPTTNSTNELFYIYAPYNVWFGYRFKNETHGMLKMGDRFESLSNEFEVLAGDMDITDTGFGLGTHPDKADVWVNDVKDSAANPWTGGGFLGAAARVSYSWWGGALKRGPVDLNFTYQDGSVRRYNDVEPSDPDFEVAAAFYDGSAPTRQNRLPMR